MRNSYRWRAVDAPGLEHVTHSPLPDGHGFRGVVIGIRDGVQFGLDYLLRTDSSWHSRELRVETTEGHSLHLHGDGKGNWTDGDGVEIRALAGCIDVDLSVSPLTNTLPIRRLASRIHRPCPIRAAWVPLPPLRPVPAEQRYTRTAPHSFLYEDLALYPGFSAVITTDSDGILLDYPGLFARS